MAHLWRDRLRGCSAKKATFALCTGNALLALFMLHAILGPLCLKNKDLAPGTVTSSDGLASAPSKKELQRIQESNRLRRQLLPTLLIERVKEIRLETEAEVESTEGLNLQKEKVAARLAERLRELKSGGNPSSTEEDKHLAADLGVSVEDLKLSLEQTGDLEDDTIPGREMPPECHAEVHADYGGMALRWGLTHHVESAADCCQACLDQAKSANATAGEKRCNIWVYCPKEGGCHSPDKYIHEHHECWLKQADSPQLNFKDTYSEKYRQQQPSAPLVVPWIAGVVSS